MNQRDVIDPQVKQRKKDTCKSHIYEPEGCNR